MQIKKQQLEPHMDWFQIGKGLRQGCIVSPCLFNLYTEYIMWNAGLDASQAGIKITGRNTNGFRYTDDTTLMAESEEELKNLLMRVKEESEKAGLKLNIFSKESEVAQSCPTLCDPMDTRLLRPWDFLGKSTGVGCHFLLQGFFPTQGSNPGLPHCRQMLYRLSHQRSDDNFNHCILYIC